MTKTGVVIEESCFLSSCRGSDFAWEYIETGIPFAGPGQARIPNLQLLTGYGLLGLQLLQIYADLVCAVCWSWSQVWKYSRNHGVFCLALC